MHWKLKKFKCKEIITMVYYILKQQIAKCSLIKLKDYLCSIHMMPNQRGYT